MILSFLQVSKPKYCLLFNCKAFKFGLHFLSVIKSNQIIRYNFFANKEIEAKGLPIQDVKELLIQCTNMSILQIFISQRISLYEKYTWDTIWLFPFYHKTSGTLSVSAMKCICHFLQITTSSSKLHQPICY